MIPADGADLDSEVLADPVDPERTGTEDQAGEKRELLRTSGGSLVPFDPFQRYLAEIRRYPRLSREQERDLARRYRETGDREALFRLVTANLMMVVQVAFSFRRAARNLLDLVQEGNLGLLNAIDRFDPELGVRLPTYAAWWVRAYMVKFLLDNVRLVRVGTTNARRRLLRNLHQEKQRLEQLGYDVGPKLLAEHFGASEQDVLDVQLAIGSRDVSLDEPLGQDPERKQGDVLADAAAPGVEELVARAELQDRARAAIDEFRRGLSQRDQAILDRRILSDDPETLQVLGDRFGTTREAVRQAEARLKRRLEDFVRDELADLGPARGGPD